MKKREIIYQYETVFDQNGAGYTVTVPKLPGLVTEGGNLKEAREMVKDAIRCYIEATLKDRTFLFSRTYNGHKEKVKIVYAWAFAAIIASIATAFVLDAFLAGSKASQELLEGITMLFAAVVLFYVSQNA